MSTDHPAAVALAANAGLFIDGDETVEFFRLQVIATIVNLTEKDLRELARIIIDVVGGNEEGG